ncbi:MAG: hypothetical protein ACOX5R_15225 [bacterium]|jgi:UDPglucose--hexose-1-phosphate uridylyltransferase
MDQFSQLRRDAHHGGWVLMCHQPEREQLLAIARQNWNFEETNDALCNPETSGIHIIWQASHKLPDGSEGKVRVIPNRFPLYRVEGSEDRVGMGMYDQMRGVGAHEIVIESERHTDSLITMHPKHYALTLLAIQERLIDLRKDSRLRAFHAFREWTCGENEKHLHPHSQIIASAIIPLGSMTELDSARQYFEYKERCLFCDMIRQEINDKVRIVYQSKEYIAFCPFASRYPFEIHLFPRKHCCDFIREPQEQFKSLAMAIQDIAARLEQAIPGWGLMMVLHTAPVFSTRRNILRTIPLDYHWHLEFLPQPPGFIDWFSRSGAHVDCTLPENAAEFLRDVEVTYAW